MTVQKTRNYAVTVTAPARLHMGFLDLHGGLGRRFGSIGLALEQPYTRLQITRATDTAAQGPDAARALRYANALMAHCGLPGDVHITIEQAIPAHAGLGSGTQMALAIGVGIARLYGLELTTHAVAQALERGARSGIGIGAFDHGGFLIDGGRGAKNHPPPLVCRMRCPPPWRVLLVFDRQYQGVSGTEERQAFADLPEFPEQEAAFLCRLLLMQVLPALAEADIHSFGRAISEIQQCIGRYFAPVQGGRFTSAEVASVLDWLSQQGAFGVGQSSWGPTGFAFCPDEASAEQLLSAVRQRWRHAGQLGFMLCRPRNSPGEVSLSDSNDLIMPRINTH